LLVLQDLGRRYTHGFADAFGDVQFEQIVSRNENTM
jgi:hypothetical protein